MGVTDGYTELRPLGEGASGAVVLARHDSTGELVAIKHLAPRLVQDPGFLERFRGEAETLRRLRHPNVAGLHWYVETETEALLAIEAINGASLRKLLDDGPTDPESALSVLRGSLLGLEHAHQAGIVHRDYKPENVIVDTTGNSRLIDFGIAVPVGGSAWLAGTPRYMAPEQWSSGTATPQTDVYAAAAVCFECLTGEAPFDAATLTGLRTQHLTEPVPVERLPEPLRELIARGMAKDPAERFATAGAFLAELEIVAAAAYGPGWAERGRKALSRSVLALALLLPFAALTGAAAVGGATALATTELGGRGGDGARGGGGVAAGGGWWPGWLSVPILGIIAVLLLGAGLSVVLVRNHGDNGNAIIGGVQGLSSSSSSTDTGGVVPPPPPSSSSSIPPPTSSITSSSSSSSSSSSNGGPVVVVPSGVISGFVINDANGNGAADPGETGISGVSVSLVQGATTTTTTTDPSGQYVFGHLQGGSYAISYQVPPGYVNTGIPSLAVVLGDRQTLAGPVFLAQLRTASVTGTVINDLNGDGLQEPGEPGLAGVTVSISGSSPMALFGWRLNLPAQTTTTDAAGNYTFGNLAQGVYSVADIPPAGFVDSGANPLRIVLAAAQGVAGESFFVQQRDAVISGTVVNDLNGNGVRDAGEPGLAGIPVVLTGAGGVLSTTTGMGGAYAFTGLPAGPYSVSYTPPVGFVNTGVNPLGVTVSPGQASAAHDFLAQQSNGSIAGAVFNDANGNGTLDAGEVGLSGVVVTLSQGATTLTQSTGGGGSYSFTSLKAGNYTLTYTPPAGFVNTGTRPLLAVLTAGGVIANRNFFAQQRNAVISGSVFDADTSAGLAGVRVRLSLGNVPMATTATNGSGAYSFTGLAAGAYRVNYTVPTGFTNVGTAPLNVSLGPGQVRSGENFLARAFGSIAGSVTWTQPPAVGVGGVTVQLFDSSNNLVANTSTTSSGAYSFNPVAAGTWTVGFIVPTHYINVGTNPLGPLTLAPGQALTAENFAVQRLGSIAGFVCDNTGGPCAYNGGLPPVSGVTVTATHAGTTLTTTTDSGGNFAFVDLVSGSWTIDYTPPPGYFDSSTRGKPQVVPLNGQDFVGVIFTVRQQSIG